MVQLLRTAGHEVVEWTPTDFMRTFELFADFVFADKGFYFNKLMKFEKVDKAIEVNNLVMKTPVFIRLLYQICR